MLSAPIILFYTFLVLVVMAIGAGPTALWMKLGGKMQSAGLRARVDRARGHFRQATAGAEFTADVDYVPVGIGFALDKSRALLFVAGDHAGRVKEALVPVAAVHSYDRGVVTGGFTDDNYVDLFAADGSWRISCGEDSGSAAAIERLLGELGLAKG
jgi:hypothetical protein